MRLIFIIGTAALAACRPVSSAPDEPSLAPAGTPAPSQDSDDPRGITIRQMDGLAGEYRAAGIDGADVNLPHAITVSIDRKTIRYVSQCVTGAWTYRFEGQALITQPVAEVVCDRGRYREEDALDALFAEPQQVIRTAAGGIELAGGGHTVTLFSQ